MHLVFSAEYLAKESPQVGAPKICVHLKDLLYDLFRGCFGPFI